ncbi:hypothetical protein DEU56DRAFT_759974 [Suillus clintonianus]|uniref:uncharacterized protein n=1 Tax=Suillus clintonianus TaxID=1904413 RepID=UPI001B871B41|nr:uncharacterized protein DEU56DRAFT_759974 [Suillus clintonianus]KAG2123564.1 hypothetical protein DEU56DRAFT_759974 [Suillus clintonianus]
MSQNSQPLREPSLLSRIGARVDDPPHHVSPSQGNPRSYHSNQREETGFTPLKNNSKGMWPRPPPGLAATTGHAGRHPQAKQHVSGSSFVDRVPDTPRTTAFSLGTATQDCNNHAYVISATVSTSGSPAGSDIKAMSVDEPLDSKQFRKQSSRMSVDPSPLTGTYRKASSRMSVDPPGLCAQRKTASPITSHSRLTVNIVPHLPLARMSRRLAILWHICHENVDPQFPGTPFGSLKILTSWNSRDVLSKTWDSSFKAGE